MRHCREKTGGTCLRPRDFEFETEKVQADYERDLSFDPFMQSQPKRWRFYSYTNQAQTSIKREAI